MLDAIPPYKCHAFRNLNDMPEAAQDLFFDELKSFDRLLSGDQPDRKSWSFLSVCAISDAGQMLGGAHLDVGPLNFGPLGEQKIAFLEAVFVRPEYRRRGIGTRVLQAALTLAKAAGCRHVRCHAAWDNPAQIALFLRAGFALTGINPPGEDGEYFAVKPL